MDWTGLIILIVFKGLTLLNFSMNVMLAVMYFSVRQEASERDPTDSTLMLKWHATASIVLSSMLLACFVYNTFAPPVINIVIRVVVMVFLVFFYCGVSSANTGQLFKSSGDDEDDENSLMECFYSGQLCTLPRAAACLTWVAIIGVFMDLSVTVAIEDAS